MIRKTLKVVAIVNIYKQLGTFGRVFNTVNCCPDANAPSYQYQQHWLNIYFIRSVSYRNITVIWKCRKRFHVKTSSCITHMPHSPRLLSLSVKHRSRTSPGRQFYRWDHDILYELTKKHKESLFSHCTPHEREMLSFWRHFHHWRYRKLSKWQFRGNQWRKCALFVIHAYIFPIDTSLWTVFVKDQFHKSHNASVPYPTMHH